MKILYLVSKVEDSTGYWSTNSTYENETNPRICCLQLPEIRQRSLRDLRTTFQLLDKFA